MSGFGLAVFGLGLLGVALYAHKRKWNWVGLALGIVAGLLLVVSALAAWLASIGGLLPYLAALGLALALICAGADMRDRRPDKTAIISAALIPTLFIMCVAQLPAIGSSVRTGWNKTGSTVSSRFGR